MVAPPPRQPQHMTVASAVHRIQQAFLDTPSTPHTILLDASMLLSRQDFDDVVTERNIIHLCGDPRCSNPLPSSRRHRGRYHISLREHRVYDLVESARYCSEPCLVSSRAFAASLQDERGRDVSQATIWRVLDLLETGREVGVEVDSGCGGELGFPELRITEKDVAGSGEVSFDEWVGPADAIEGYVPQHDYDHNQGGSKSATGIKANLAVKDDREIGNNDAKPSSSCTVPSNMDHDLLHSTSETIAKQLEDMNLYEKKAVSERASSVTSKKAKAIKWIDNNTSDDIVLKNSIIAAGEEKVAHPIEYPSGQGTKGIRKNYTTEEASTMDPDLLQDASALISRQLEDMLLDAEKVTSKSKSTKSIKAKARKGIENDKIEKHDFKSSIIVGDDVIAAPQTVYLASKDRTKDAPKDIEGRIHTGMKAPNITSLKSSLKTSDSGSKNRNVTWADKKKEEGMGSKSNVPDLSSMVPEEHTDDTLRRSSAEACASALAHAADAVSSGKMETTHAVCKAGILILPPPKQDKGHPEEDEDVITFDQDVKWLKKSVPLDTDFFDVEDSWYDTPPEGFSLTLSSFANIWMVLFGWITRASLAYVYGRDASSQDDFSVVNGREYPPKVVLVDGKSSDIRRTAEECIGRAIPRFISENNLRKPVSTIEKAVGLLLDTMTFMEAVPPFRTLQWHIIILVFVDALSLHRFPSLASNITGNRMLLNKVLNAAQISGEEYRLLRDLILPLGSEPLAD